MPSECGTTPGPTLLGAILTPLGEELSSAVRHRGHLGTSGERHALPGSAAQAVLQCCGQEAVIPPRVRRVP